jgi:NADH-quinone oxidoreductase subunit D
MCSGQRMMTTYIRPGGLWRDVPVEFETAVRNFIKAVARRIDEYEALLTKNPIFLDRTAWHRRNGRRHRPAARGDRSDAARFRRELGPAQGHARTWATSNTTSTCPTSATEAIRTRYMVRMEELRESLKIMEQALNKLPMGPVRSDNRKFVAAAALGDRREHGSAHPPLQVVDRGLQCAEGVRVQRGRIAARRAGRDLEGDGGPKPLRVHWRTPSFDNLSVVPKIVKGHLVADLVAILGFHRHRAGRY